MKIATILVDNSSPYFFRTNYFWGKKVVTGVNDETVPVHGEPTHQSIHTYKIEWYIYKKMTWHQCYNANSNAN